MGDDIDCCVRPDNLGKKDLRTNRGIKPKNNPKIPASNPKDFDNFGSFKRPNNSEKNSNKKGNYLNSVYSNENESRFPNFSEFEIEPVSEPLYNEQISQPQPQYGNTQYIDSNPTILQPNQIIQNTNYINPINQYSPPQIQSDINQYAQPEFDMNNINNNIQNNSINDNINTQEYMNNNNSTQQIEYINSKPDENLIKEYGNTHNILPTKYIQIQRPVIYENNSSGQSTIGYNQSPITNYVESSSTNQQYEQYNFNNNIPQYYETNNNNINYITSNTENVYSQTSQNVIETTSPIMNEIQYSKNLSQASYIQQPQQIFLEQKTPPIYIAPESEIEKHEYIQQHNNDNENEVNKKEIRKRKKGPSDGGHKKPKRIKRIIEYYSDDEEEEEEDDDNEEEKEDNNSSNEESEEKKTKNKKVIIKRIKKHNHKNKEKVKNKKKIQNPPNHIVQSSEEKENKNINENNNKDYEPVINKNKLIEKNEKQNEDEEEFSGFQKEPEMTKESLEDMTIKNFDDIYENRIKEDDIIFNNKKNEKQVLSLKNGSKIVGNFKREEIQENRNEMAEKEREDLFSGKTLKVASVEKKEESTGCQVPGFISNIFSKIF